MEGFDRFYPATDAERETALGLIEVLAQEVHREYEVVELVGRGGAGLVLKARDLRIPTSERLEARQDAFTYRAIKVPRPLAGHQAALAALLNKEAGFLSSLTHSNLVKLYACGTVSFDGINYPYYVMDYVERARSPREYAIEAGTSLTDVARVFREVLDAFVYLGRQGIRHNDPKPGNILIDGAGRAVVSDLGAAKRAAPEAGETVLAFTREYAPREKRDRAAKSPSSENRVELRILPADIPEWWDVHSLGLTFYKVLDAYAQSHPTEIPVYEYTFLRLMIGRMLGHEILESECVLGLAPSFFKELRYESCIEVQLDLSKLDDGYSLTTRVPELNLASHRVLQCPMSGTVPWTDRLSELVRHPLIKRLSSVSQLGLTQYVYPSATGTRYEHTLGSYGNAVRMVAALWNDPGNPLFRQIMSADDLSAVLLAVLLHDLGQYPLAHDLEEADKDRFKHEKLTVKLMDAVTADISISLSRLLDGLWDEGMSNRVKAILSAEPEKAAQHPLKDRILHTIVDGPIDADRADYVCRDSMRLNVPYGGILDYERLIGSLTVVHRQAGQHVHAALGIYERGRISAECVAFARYALIASAYWHHTCRAIKAMIHRAVWEGMASGEWTDPRNVGRELLSLVIENKLPAITPMLFADAAHTVAAPVWPGMCVTDLQMLLWLHARTSENAKRLLEGLLERRVYKRAALVTDEKLGKRLHRLRSEGGGATMLKLQRRVTGMVAEHLSNLGVDKRLSTGLGEAQTSSFEERARAEEPLLLIDVPNRDISRMGDLLCLAEVENWRLAQEASRIRDLSDSLVWKALVDSMGGGVAKIRVFAHPDFAQTARAIVPTDLNDILVTAVEDLAY